MKARLQPPLSLQRPGSYDFGRDMYFQRIGASGFVLGAIKAADPPDSGGLALRYSAFMQGLRDADSSRNRGSATRMSVWQTIAVSFLWVWRRWPVLTLSGLG